MADEIPGDSPIADGAPADERRPRILRVDLEYDGAGFLGWQRQREGRTVQAVVEEALARILGAPHAVVGAGRTDAGAHARQMVASFRTRRTMPAASLARALDAVLPPDVGIREVQDAPPGFHARRDAEWKWYRYTLDLARRKRPLRRRTSWRVRGRLDPEALSAAARTVRGRHDFASFSNAGSPRASTVRTLWAVRWTGDEELLHLDVVGNGFLYKMIRTLVGTMVKLARVRSVGEGASSPLVADQVGRAMRRILEAADRRAAGPATPAHGLCLMAVGVTGEDPACRLPSFLLRDVESSRRCSSGERL